MLGDELSKVFMLEKLIIFLNKMNQLSKQLDLGKLVGKNDNDDAS